MAMNHNEKPNFHVVMLPWLAIGHMYPFFNLSTRLASRGVRVSFISTPKAIQKLPKIPPHLSHLIELTSFPLPQVDNLPHDAECTSDIPYNKHRFLKQALNLLIEGPLSDFLAKFKPDWIIYDFLLEQIPTLAAKLGISSFFFSAYNAATLCFAGPPGSTNEGGLCSVPKWIPFESNLHYHRYEVMKLAKLLQGDGGQSEDRSENNEGKTNGLMGETSLVAIRSGHEVESKWIDLLENFYQKPVLPVGYLFPFPENDESSQLAEERFDHVKSWLDKQKESSVVYVAFGSEANVSQDEVTKLAHGLDSSGLPFFWILKGNPSEESQELSLPAGFEERTYGRGIVYRAWAPQVEILGHPAVGGFLTASGWSSVIEGLGFGRVLILFPSMNDQPLLARLLHGEKLGVEIQRNEHDGTFTSELVAETLRLAMVDEEGELLRANARNMKDVVADKKLDDLYIDMFVCYLEKNRKSSV